MKPERSRPDWNVSNMTDKFRNLSVLIGLDLNVLNDILNIKIPYSKGSIEMNKEFLKVIDLIINNSYNLTPNLWYFLMRYHCYAKYLSAQSTEDEIEYEMLDIEIRYLHMTGQITYSQYLNMCDRIDTGAMTPYNCVYYIESIPYNSQSIELINRIIRNPIRKECPLLQDLLDLFDFDVLCNKDIIINNKEEVLVV